MGTLPHDIIAHCRARFGTQAKLAAAIAEYRRHVARPECGPLLRDNLTACLAKLEPLQAAWLAAQPANAQPEQGEAA